MPNACGGVWRLSARRGTATSRTVPAGVHSARIIVWCPPRNRRRGPWRGGGGARPGPASGVRLRPPRAVAMPDDGSSAGRGWPSPRSWEMAALLCSAAAVSGASAQARAALIMGAVGSPARAVLRRPRPQRAARHVGAAGRAARRRRHGHGCRHRRRALAAPGAVGDRRADGRLHAVAGRGAPARTGRRRAPGQGTMARAGVGSMRADRRGDVTAERSEIVREPAARSRRWLDGLPPVTAKTRCDGRLHSITWRRGKLVLEDNDLLPSGR